MCLVIGTALKIIGTTLKIIGTTLPVIGTLFLYRLEMARPEEYESVKG